MPVTAQQKIVIFFISKLQYKIINGERLVM